MELSLVCETVSDNHPSCIGKPIPQFTSSLGTKGLQTFNHDGQEHQTSAQDEVKRVLFPG